MGEGGGTGLLATFVALLAMQQAQPALLYLVPATLGTVLAVAWRRQEFSKVNFFNGSRMHTSHRD